MVIETPQKRKRLNYIAAFSVTALILIIGIFIGWQFTNYKFKNFQYEQEKLNLLIIGLDLKETITNEPGCDLDIDRLMEDKVRVGGDVGLLEERLGKENKDVLLKKEFYQLVEVKTILLLDKISGKYNVEKAPTMVINGNIYGGMRGLTELESFIKK